MTRLIRFGAGRAGGSAPHSWLVRLATTLAAWLAAFLVVMALFSLLGDQLGSLPLAVRALAISGVLVTVMVNLVMPPLGRLIARWFGEAPGAPETIRSGHRSADARASGASDQDALRMRALEVRLRPIGRVLTGHDHRDSTPTQAIDNAGETGELVVLPEFRAGLRASRALTTSG